MVRKREMFAMTSSFPHKLPMPSAAALLLAMALSAGPAFAEETPAAGPDDGKGRYALSPVDGGVLRLDKETGAMTLCTRKADQWLCEGVQDKSIDAAKGDAPSNSPLEAENKALKDRIRVLEESLAIAEGTNKPAAPGDAPPGDAPPGTQQLPTEEEVDKAFDYVERIIKKFRERIQKYGTPGDPTAPDGSANKAPESNSKPL